MRLFGGIEMRPGECSLVLLDEHNREVICEDLNSISEITACVSPFSRQLVGFAVKPLGKADWLINGLGAAGFSVYVADISIPDEADQAKHEKKLTAAAFLAKLLAISTNRKSRPKRSAGNKPAVKNNTSGKWSRSDLASRFSRHQKIDPIMDSC